MAEVRNRVDAMVRGGDRVRVYRREGVANKTITARILEPFQTNASNRGSFWTYMLQRNVKLVQGKVVLSHGFSSFFF